MGKPNEEETITYDGICPYCSTAVVGELKSGNVCITTFCDGCDMFLLEDEVDWEFTPEMKELDFTKDPREYLSKLELELEGIEEGDL